MSAGRKQDDFLFGVLTAAFRAAETATDAYLIEHPDEWYPCGFAWVHFDGRSPAVKVLKSSFNEQRRGHKAYPKGWDVWNPSGHPTQCMEAKLAGAQAFVQVLKQAGIECYPDCRMD